MQLLFHYKNKIGITTSDLNQQISNEKFKISIDDSETLVYEYFYRFDKYLINEFKKKDINIYIIKYLVELGANINKEDIKKIYVVKLHYFLHVEVKMKP